MTFEALEESRYEAVPVDLYKFIYGPGPTDFLAYTNAEQAITVLGVQYQPIPIQREAIKSSGTLDKASMTISTPINAGIADFFLYYPPSQVISLIIRQGHPDDLDGEFPVCWSGRVLGGSRENSTFAMTCEPVATSLKRTAMRRHYQYGCPHVLYGDGCNANKAAATITTTAITVSGNVLTVAGGWAADPLKPKYIGGLVTWVQAGRAEVRTILRVNGPLNRLTCSGRLSGLVNGESVSVTLGCNRQMTDCKDLHDNLLNFGGHPWIPKKNPIGFYNHFY